jgi:hypothetical protein
LETAFRKISRVPRLTGTTRWYLSDDCLLAAKQVLYAVEYRRFYLRDLESIVVWPSRTWLLRPIIPGVLFGIVGALLWHWQNFSIAAFAFGPGLVWVLGELASGPTAKSRVRTTGATVDLPLVSRTRRARKILAKIDEAVRAARATDQVAGAVGAPQPAQANTQTDSQAAPAVVPTGDLT